MGPDPFRSPQSMTMVKQVTTAENGFVKCDQDKFLALIPETTANSDCLFRWPEQAFAGGGTLSTDFRPPSPPPGDAQRGGCPRQMPSPRHLHFYCFAGAKEEGLLELLPPLGNFLFKQRFPGCYFSVLNPGVGPWNLHFLSRHSG